jgi:hypothetical protein
VQVARHLTSDAAEAADDVVVGVGIDHLLDATLFEQPAELARDEELRHRRKAVEEGNDAEQLEPDLEDPTPGVARIGDRPNGRDRVDRPLEPVGQRGALDDREAGGSHDHQH